MTTQVDRLETLLARVQGNRQRPRAASPDAMAAKQVAGAHMAPVATAPLHSAQVAQQMPQAAQQASRGADARPPAKPAAAPSAAQAAPRAQATPLEMALEGQGRSPAGQRPMQSSPLQSSPLQSSPLQSSPLQSSPLQPAPAAPVSYDGRVLVDPQPPSVGRPIAQVVSMHPPSQALTFGELLRRSLSLRPR